MTSPELSTPEMAAAALSCEAFADAVKLAAWLGPGRELTASGVLRPAIAVQACQALGIPLASGKLRSAMDVPELERAWTVALAAGLILVAANRHLHMFTAGKARYGVPDGDFMTDDQNENAVRLSDLLSRKGQKLSYTYDFGDDWEHLITLEKSLPPGSPQALAAGPVPVCLAGEGACPPEDCGGAWGYGNLKEALANPDHHDHEDMLEWLGLDEPGDFDPAEFDLAEVNERLRG